MSVRMVSEPIPTARSQTTIAWRRPRGDEILVTVHGALNQVSRDLFRSVIARAITQHPRRIVVETSEYEPFDSDVNYELIVGLQWQANAAGVSLVSATHAES